MKTNAPERIWINLTTDLPKLSGHINKDSIEYTRTDAFIEKATEWLENRGCLYVQYSEGGTSFNNKQFIEDFKKAMTQ